MFTSQDNCLGTFSRKTSFWLVPEPFAFATVHNVVLKKAVYLHSAHATPTEQREMKRSVLFCLISKQVNQAKMKK